MIDKKNLQKYIFFKRCKKKPQQNCCDRRIIIIIPIIIIPYSSHLSPFLPDSQYLTVSKFHSRYPHPAYPKFFLCHLTAFTASLSFFSATVLHLHAHHLQLFFPFMSVRQLPSPCLLSIDFSSPCVYHFPLPFSLALISIHTSGFMPHCLWAFLFFICPCLL